MFELIVNFRDFGQKPLRGGGRLRSGVLLRSASLGAATPGDVERLARHNIGVIVDLRRIGERKIDPNRLPPGFSGRIIENQDATPGEAPHLTFMRQAARGPNEVHRMALAYYRVIPNDEHIKTAVRAAVDALLETDGAMLVHCSAGKDRTGFVSALLLEALGAHEDDILTDYLASTELVAEHRIDALLESMERAVGQKLPLEAVRAMFGIDPAWLHEARRSIAENYGSAADYAAHVGLTPATVDALRARLSA